MFERCFFRGSNYIERTGMGVFYIRRCILNAYDSRYPSAIRSAYTSLYIPQGGGESKRTGHFASEDALSEKNIPSRIKSNEHEELH